MRLPLVQLVYPIDHFVLLGLLEHRSIVIVLPHLHRLHPLKLVEQKKYKCLHIDKKIPLKNYRQPQLLLCPPLRSEEHTSELQSRFDLVCRLLLEKKKMNIIQHNINKFTKNHNTRVYNSCNIIDSL